MADDPSLIYTLTPEVDFSPSVAKSQYQYRVGTKMSAHESRHVEYKIGNYALNNLGEHIRRYGSAFLNSNGGTLAVGVADDGIYAPSYVKEKIRKQIEEEFEAFKPSVNNNFFEIDFVPTDQRDKYVLELHVRAGEEEEIYVGRDDKMYMKRDGSVQGPLWPRNIKEIVIQKFVKTLNTEENTTSSSTGTSLVQLADATPVLSRAKS